MQLNLSPTYPKNMPKKKSIIINNNQIAEIKELKKKLIGNSLVVQWLGFRAFIAKGPGSIPGRGTKILQAALCGQINK